MALNIFGSGKDKNKKKNQQIEETDTNHELVDESIQAAHQQVMMVDITAIIPNRFQPRKVFDEEKIVELSRTIHIHGLIQPMVIREFEPGQYEIIAGERRFRAMQYLGWTEVPAIVQELTDTETASVALIENLQREELTAIEEARAYQRLIELNSLTQEALAQRVGKSQSAIANKLRLLKLSEPVQDALLAKSISERHGRSLLALDEEQQQGVLEQIIAENLNVKEAEAIILAILEKNKPKAEKAKKRKVGVSKDVRLAVNTIKKSISLVQETGIDLAVNEETDLEDVYRIVIEIPKKKKQ